MSFLDKFGVDSYSDLINQVKDGFFGDAGNLKDYSHASKLMRPNGLALAPKQKFLFHVYFNLTNPSMLKSATNDGIVGALVKSAQLPSFKLETKEHIQYNRKRLVHNRITYEPITIKLHDDGEGHVLDMWNKYYQYYFADSQYGYTAPKPPPAGKTDYNKRDLYSDTRVKQKVGWGKTVTDTFSNDASKPAFFKDIKIYGFNRGAYVAYTLINPVITSWQHDTYDYAAGNGVMEHTVTLQYEAVKYSDGPSVNKDSVDGFGDKSRYDTEPGALGPGSTESLYGTGGLADTAAAVENDLASGNYLGAIQKAGASATTFGSVGNLVNVVTGDSVGVVTGAVLGGLSSPTRLTSSFPTPTASNNTNTSATPRKVE